jgi:two-component system OmpR family sensor kinase
MRRLGIRRRLLLVVLATLVLAVTGLVAGFNLVLGATLDRNARDLVRSRADAQIASLRVEHGQLRVGESPDDRATDAYLWVFAGARVLERPRAATQVEGAVRGLVGGPARYETVSSTDTLLYAAPVVARGRRVGTVAAGLSLAPYEDTRATALIASLVLGAVVLLLVGLIVWWLLGASLRPVVRMTRQAAAWSEHDLDHRFGLGPAHDELTELGATLDGLLDRLAASLRRERRFSAELSHELRTPLAGLLAESEVALRRRREPEEYRQTLELIHESADQLSRTVDALVAAARYEAGGDRGTADAESIASGATAACTGLAQERQIEVEVAQPAQPVRVGVDSDLAERILQPVLENACRYATSRVRVAISRADTGVVYAIEDDGPGVSAEERERIFEPGVRGAAAGVNGTSGAGLGLSLARRLARSVDGEVEAGAASEGGRFVVRLPTG